MSNLNIYNSDYDQKLSSLTHPINPNCFFRAPIIINSIFVIPT